MCRCFKLQTTIACFLLPLCCQNSLATAQKPKAASKKIETIARFTLPDEALAECKVQSTNKDGKITLKYRGTLSEGYFIAVMIQNDEGRESGDRFKFFKLKVEEIKDNSVVVIHAGINTAAFLGEGDELHLFRPNNSTTAIMKMLPEMIDLTVSESLQAKMKSRENLKQLAIAVHNYHEFYNRFPPAVIYGSDGKPWHSWRVLLLPFLRENKLYKQYKMNEPWNGPNNKKLLSKMPEIYRDSVYGDKKEFFTNYAAVVGVGTVFPPNAASYKKNANGKLILEYNKKIRFRDVIDGTSNTTMFGTIGPDHKIPWMKPDDVPLGKIVSKLGSKNSFSTPFTIGTSKAAMFVWCDGSTSFLPETFRTKTLKNLFIRNDGNVISGTEMGIRFSNRMKNIEIYRDKNEVKARIIYIDPYGNNLKPQILR